MHARCSSSMRRPTESGAYTCPPVPWNSNPEASASIRSWRPNAPGAICPCRSPEAICTSEILAIGLFLLDRVHQRLGVGGLGHLGHFRIRACAKRCEFALQLIDHLQDL